MGIRCSITTENEIPVPHYSAARRKSTIFRTPRAETRQMSHWKEEFELPAGLLAIVASHDFIIFFFQRAAKLLAPSLMRTTRSTPACALVSDAVISWVCIITIRLPRSCSEEGETMCNKKLAVALRMARRIFPCCCISYCIPRLAIQIAHNNRSCLMLDGGWSPARQL